MLITISARYRGHIINRVLEPGEHDLPTPVAEYLLATFSGDPFYVRLVAPEPTLPPEPTPEPEPEEPEPFEIKPSFPEEVKPDFPAEPKPKPKRTRKPRAVKPRTPKTKP